MLTGWQIEEIAAVDGIDVLFVGPFDLGNNIGHPVRGGFDDELKAAITRIHETAVKAGKISGIYCPDGKTARTYADAGFKMVSVTCCISAYGADQCAQISVVNDMSVLPLGLAEALSHAKGSKQEAAGVAYGGSN